MPRVTRSSPPPDVGAAPTQPVTSSNPEAEESQQLTQLTENIQQLLVDTEMDEDRRASRLHKALQHDSINVPASLTREMKQDIMVAMKMTVVKTDKKFEEKFKNLVVSWVVYFCYIFFVSCVINFIS